MNERLEWTAEEFRRQGYADVFAAAEFFAADRQTVVRLGPEGH